MHLFSKYAKEVSVVYSHFLHIVSRFDYGIIQRELTLSAWHESPGWVKILTDDFNMSCSLLGFRYLPIVRQIYPLYMIFKINCTSPLMPSLCFFLHPRSICHIICFNRLFTYYPSLLICWFLTLLSL